MSREPDAAIDLDLCLVDLAANSAALEAIERSEPRLSRADLERTASMAGRIDEQSLWRASRIALRVMLEHRRDVSAGTVRRVDFVVDPGGRPALPSRRPYFSMSHSGSMALIAIAGDAPVGVDLECDRSVAIAEPRRTRIVDAGRRLAGLAPSIASGSDDEVLRAWVCIEAAAKALGMGVGRMLTMQGIRGGKGSGAPPMPELEVRSLDIEFGYAAVAARRLPQHSAVRRVCFADEGIRYVPPLP